MEKTSFNIFLYFRKFCRCGLEKRYHSTEALQSQNKSWNPSSSTQTEYPVNFGNLDIPGHYNYLETPGGTVGYVLRLIGL